MVGGADSASVKGSLKHPVAFGTAISTSGWKVSVVGSQMDAVSLVHQDHPELNPPAGMTYAVASLHYENIDDDSSMPLAPSVAFVDAEGNAIYGRTA